MRHRLLRWLCAMLSVIPVMCWGAALPTADMTAESPALRAAMTSLLDDYARRLPALHSLEGRRGSDGTSHSWSPARDQLGLVCKTERGPCERLLSRQYDTLFAAFRKRWEAPPITKEDAVLVSAMVDLCSLAWGMEVGTRCLPSELRMLSSAAASVWHLFGYQHLFLVFQKAEEQHTAQLDTWTRQNDSLTPAQKAERLQGLAASVTQTTRRAFAAELEGRYADALGQWSFVFARLSVANNDPQQQLTALANMARLSAQQGRFERARQWQQAGQSLAGVHPELRKSEACSALQQQFDIDMEHGFAAGTAFDGVQRFMPLIAQECSFSGRGLTLALGSLAHGRAAEAVQVLDAARVACDRPPQCGQARIVQIGQLLAVARNDAAAWRQQAAAWTERFKAPDDMLAIEIDIAWALAERLRASGAVAEALPLFQQLDRHVGMLRKARNSPPDMARYDALTRMRVRLEVTAGTLISLDDTESLRGQKLLRQLTLARWTRQLAGVQDAAALAELNERLQYAVQLRQAVAAIPPDQFPLVKVTFDYMLEDMKEMELGFREAYLARLAGRQRGDDPSRSSYVMPLSFFEKWDAFRGADARALDEDDAYLSWLRVPGGYVGTLMARPSGRKGVTDASHPPEMTQRFIAFSEQDEALLELYRQMLQNGAGTLRGARVSAPMEADGAGLMLGKEPLWQLADGSVIAAASAPAGARRVTTFSTLGNALYQRLLAPFAPLYQEAQRLIVSPDGALVYLPFETLTRQGISVLESVDIGYVQSLAVYGELKKRVASRHGGSPATLLSVADPAYAASPSPGAASPMASLTWPPLPGTRTESRAISGLFRQPRLMLGAAASKTGLDALAQKKELRSFQVLHFATHGYVDDERSALVLTPGASPMSAYLSDQEIVQWELESDLVLLSACNTGIGRRQQGEGVVGLPYAFFMAGNLNTLMSLWPVDDQGTAALIPAFMQRIQHGEDHVTALNNTKRAFARGEYGQAMKNPRIWSAFVLYGVPLTAAPTK
jgi:CHAT domain-containing protein